MLRREDPIDLWSRNVQYHRLLAVALGELTMWHAHAGALAGCSRVLGDKEVSFRLTCATRVAYRVIW